MRDKISKALKYWQLLLLGFLILTNVYVWSVVWYERPTDILTISFLDVGQGDAIFIEGPTHQQVLIDGGPAGRLAAPLAKVMPWYDRSIDWVVATHPDADHIGGLPMVFERYRVANFIESGAKGNTGVASELQVQVKNEHSKSSLARRGQVLDIGGGASLQILFPDQDVSRRPTNEASIIAKLIYGSTTVMLTGDSPQKIEKYLVKLDPVLLKATVLKLGHHGSKTSSSAEFLKAVSPQLAIISAGLNNRYGHPHAEVTDRLTKFGIKVLRTEDFSKSGTITLVSDGVKFIEK